MEIVRPGQHALQGYLPAGGTRRHLTPRKKTNPNPLIDPDVTLAYRFTDGTLDPAVGAALLTFTRNSVGTYYDSAGVLQTAAINEPRFDHGPTSLTPLGLLIEATRTNVCLQSEDFAILWAVQRVTVDVNAATAPDGTLTADRMAVVNGSNGNHNLYQTIAVVDGSTYCSSCYFKDDGAGFAGICYGNGTNWVSVQWNLVTGAFDKSAVGSGSGTLISHGIEALPNGWYRCHLVGSAVGPGIDFIPYASQGGTINIDGRPSYVAIGGEDLLLWGAQRELGTGPTSYIATVAAPVARGVESCFTLDLTWQTAGVGTYYVEFSKPFKGSGDLYILAGNASERLLYFGSSGAIQTYEGVNINTVVPGTAPYGIKYKFANGYADADLTQSAYANGVLGVDGIKAYAPGGFNITTRLNIGNSDAGSQPISGHIAAIAYAPVRKPNDYLQQITAAPQAGN